MAEARRRDAWDRTSLLAALLVAPYAKKGRVPKPEEFHPLAKRDRPPRADMRYIKRRYFNQGAGTQ